MGLGTHWVLPGFSENTGGAEGEQFWFATQCESVPAGGVSVTKAAREGSSWVSGEEVALGVAVRHVSHGAL